MFPVLWTRPRKGGFTKVQSELLLVGGGRGAEGSAGRTFGSSDRARGEGSRGQGATHSHAIPMWIQAEYAENPAFLEKATAESLPVIQ